MPGETLDVIRIDDQSVRDELMTLTRLNLYPSPLHALLLGQLIEWQEFDRWHDHFTSHNDWPRSWFKVIKRPTAPDYLGYYDTFAAFRALSPPSRYILTTMNVVGRSRLTSNDQILERSGLSYELSMQSISELTNNGFLRPTTQIEALGRHTVETLKDELGMLDLKKTGRKAQLIERLAAEAPDYVLDRLVPSSFIHNSRTLEYLIPDIRNPAFLFESVRVDILASYCQNLRFRADQLENSERWAEFGPPNTVTIHASLDSCHVCRQHQGKKIEVTRKNINELPPYHPGCTCRTETHYSQLGSTS